MICDIINKGVPPAEFRWMKINKYMPKDLIITNNTHTVLMLSNLTQYNSGDYLCIAYSKHQSVWKTLYLQLQGLYAY